MLFLILINVQYLQNVVFSFENGWNGPDHSSLVSHHPEKKFPLLHNTIWKTQLLCFCLCVFVISNQSTSKPTLCVGFQ